MVLPSESSHSEEGGGPKRQQLQQKGAGAVTLVRENRDDKAEEASCFRITTCLYIPHCKIYIKKNKNTKANCQHLHCLIKLSPFVHVNPYPWHMPFFQVSNNIRVVLESVFSLIISSLFFQVPTSFLLALHPLAITRVHSLGSHPPVNTLLCLIHPRRGHQNET